MTRTHLRSNLAYAQISAVIILVLTGLISFYGGSLSGQSTQAKTVVDPRNPGRTATLTFGTENPTQPTLQEKVVQKIPIRLDTGGANVQSAEIAILFPVHSVQVSDFIPNTSFCSQVEERRIDTEGGTAYLKCTTSSVGFTTQLSTIANLIVTPQTSSSILLRFDRDRTEIYGRSNNGTSVLARAEDRSFAIGTDTPTLFGSYPDSIPSSESTPLQPQLVPISSPSHPITSSCTPATTATLQWIREKGVARFNYSWTDRSEPGEWTSTVSTSISLPTKPGTSHFLHLQAIGNNNKEGPVSSYRVTTCP